MTLADVLRRVRAPRRPAAPGPEGVAVRLRDHNRPSQRESGRILPGPLWWALLLGTAFYVVAHLSIITGVWSVHGTSPGAGGTLLRDAVALGAWLAMLFALRWMGYRGSWPVVVLPVLVFLLARPIVFQAFTDPAYQATRESRAEMNEAKATRARLSTIDRAYTPERQRVVYGGDVPPLADPFESAVRRETASRGLLARMATYLPVLLAPVVLLAGFAAARSAGLLRTFRDRRLLPFVPTLAVFFVLAVFFTARSTGKVFGTTPWELFLPLFVGTWAATLADDSYNLARPGAVVKPHRLLQLFLYGACPVIPFLVIRELGLSIVLAGSMAAMLLVGTRRGWWAGVMMAVWAVLVVAAFNLDDRSATRLELAYDPYKDAATMSADSAESWAARLHQMKLFDANVLAGGLLGEGAGRGHGETAPNAADDGYITLVAAQWGWAGGLAIVLVYTLFLAHMLGVAVRERGAFERTLVTGLAMLIAVPFWLATLGGIRVIPLTGVAAAFAAHGGAKLLASALAVGIVAGISHRRALEDRLDGALAPPSPDDAAPAARGVRIR